MEYGILSSYSWTLEAILRLVAAAVLGAAIGMEREYHGRSAGFRTQLLVALGSALAMVVSLSFAKLNYAGWAAGEAIRIDPARVAYNVMGGIGFLGAGAIIRYGGGTRGLTTAASLWCTAAVGLACGFGLYLVAGAATALIVFALLFLSRLDRLIPSKSSRMVTVTLSAAGGDNIARIRDVLGRLGVYVVSVDFERNLSEGLETITCYVTLPARFHPADLSAISADVPGVVRLGIR